MEPEELDKGAFWDGKILAWESSRYKERSSGHSLLERLAGRASASLRFRISRSLELIAPHIASREIIEIGCGSGITAPEAHKPAHHGTGRHSLAYESPHSKTVVPSVHRGFESHPSAGNMFASARKYPEFTMNPTICQS